MKTTFFEKVTVRIKKDKKYLKYIQIIRKYDNSLSMTQIKDAMEKGEVVFGYDPSHNPIIHSGKDNSGVLLSEIFLKTLRELKKTGADMTVTAGGMEYVEFAKVSVSKGNIDKLIENLFETADGGVAFEAIEKLKKAAKKSEAKRPSVIEAMMKYSDQTNLSHMKSLIIPTINRLVKENEFQYENFYKSKIENGDHAETYYAIEGYSKIMQKSAYNYLVDTLLARRLDMECEGLIVREISHLSNQPFAKDAPYEFRDWKESDLKLAEIEKWKKEGYPDGIEC